MIYSRPKTGKTTLASKLPRNLILDLEGGTKAIEALTKECLTYSAFVEFIKELRAHKAEHGSLPYDFITLDTATKLEEWCEVIAYNDYKASIIGKSFQGKSIYEIDQGGGYYWLREAFKRQIAAIESLGIKVIYMCHLKDAQLAKDSTEPLTSELDLIGKNRSIMGAFRDAIGYLHSVRDPLTDTSELQMRFAPGGAALSGSRYKHMAGKTLVLAKYDAQGEMVDVRWDLIYPELSTSTQPSNS